MRARLLALALLAGAYALPASAADVYTMDPNHTQIRFGWSHFGFSNLSAGFEKFTGELKVDTADWSQSSVNISIPMTSLHTGVSDFDDHLKSADFFDSEKFPEATFKSTQVEKVSDTALKVTGDLTLHGITKSVVLDVTVNKLGKHPISGKDAAGFDAKTMIKRSDFKVDKYVPNVSDDIWIQISTETKKG